MKTDLNTIVYIIISIIIIAASSLGRKKKKPAGGLPGQDKERPGAADPGVPFTDLEEQRTVYQPISRRQNVNFLIEEEETDPDLEGVVPEEEETGTGQAGPLWNRDWIREETGVPPGRRQMTIEQDQAFADEEQRYVDEEEQVVDEEEEIVDEEELYISDKEEAGRETMMKEVKILMEEEPPEDLKDDDLFLDAWEIRRAIIYSEILKRPEY